MARTSLALLALLVVSLCGSVSYAVAQDGQGGANNVGLGLRGLGARIGFVDPEDASSTVALGAHLDAGTLVRNVHVIPSVEYWSAGAEVGGLSADLSDLTIATDINLDFPVQGSRIVPYFGGGLGIHFLSAESTGTPGDDDTKLGLNIQGGIRNEIMPNISLFGEARYAFVSDMNQLKLMGGFTYNFIY